MNGRSELVDTLGRLTLFADFAVLYTQMVLMNLMGQYIMYDLRKEIFGHLQRLDTENPARQILRHARHRSSSERFIGAHRRFRCEIGACADGGGACRRRANHSCLG